MTKNVTACKVAVLAGGWSDEREVSLMSGREVTAALGEAGFEQVDMLDVAAPGFIDDIAHGGYDVAFVALHGRYGEDGCVQGLLEVLHIPYTFSGVLASAMTMEKGVAKAIYRRAGIPVADDVVLANGEPIDDARLDQIVADLGLPLFVKPADNGSSYGISRVTDRASLGEAIRRADAEGARVLVESAVSGTEITVPVIGNENPQALAVIEVVTGAEFYDVNVKYEPSELHHVIPARLAPQTYALAQQTAIQAHVALGCRGCSRSDFIVRDDGIPVILETNSIPGMTAASLLPDSARHVGITFPELCTRFVEFALEGEE